MTRLDGGERGLSKNAAEKVDSIFWVIYFAQRKIHILGLSINRLKRILKDGVVNGKSLRSVLDDDLCDPILYITGVIGITTKERRWWPPLDLAMFWLWSLPP